MRTFIILKIANTNERKFVQFKSLNMSRYLDLKNFNFMSFEHYRFHRKFAYKTSPFIQNFFVFRFVEPNLYGIITLVVFLLIKNKIIKLKL